MHIETTIVGRPRIYQTPRLPKRFSSKLRSTSFIGETDQATIADMAK
jgi:hypothetical protein